MNKTKYYKIGRKWAILIRLNRDGIMTLKQCNKEGIWGSSGIVNIIVANEKEAKPAIMNLKYGTLEVKE